MFEGKHIHFSPTDNKPLCSYSGKICRQRRLNGYAFCIRHILEDKSSPFKQCSYVTRNNSQKCLNAIPANQDRGYCHSHMQVVGIIPKTERKSKTQTAKVDTSLNSNCTQEKSPPTSASSIVKKDPGAVFKFVEEESNDITEVFSYKNGLSNGSLNGKSKASKGKEGSSQAKDVKTIKSQNGFTTRKITDKNKNVYTAVIATTNSTGGNNSKSKRKGGTTDRNSATEISSLTAQQKSSSRPAHANSRVQRDTSGGGELNKSHDVEEIRQFEQLKALKQLDKSPQSSNNSSEEDGDAKFKIFPRLAVKSSIPDSGISSLLTNQPKSEKLPAPDEDHKSEIVFTPPAPPLITRSNNGIIIKTEPQGVVPETTEINSNTSGDDENILDKQSSSCSSSVILSSGNTMITNNNSNNHCDSIESRDLKSRHEFLAHVRNTFKSQYKTIKKACKISERCERNSKLRFRKSLMRCVRIDSSICAQVLSGYGLKFLTTPVKTEVDTTDNEVARKKKEYDDYEFFDNEDSSAFGLVEQKGKKPPGGKETRKSENSSKGGKTKAQRRPGGKGKEAAFVSDQSNNNNNEDALGSSKIRVNKRADKSKTAIENVKESKFTCSPSSKKKLRRADAVVSSPEQTLSNCAANDAMQNPAEGIGFGAALYQNTNGDSSAATVGRKRRLDVLDIPNGVELGLPLSSQSSSVMCNVSSAFDINDHVTTANSAMLGKCEKTGGQSLGHHHRTNPNVSSTMNDPQELQDIIMLSHSKVSTRRNQGLETVLNSVGSSENAGTPDGVITDASFDSTFEHSTSSQPDCDFSEDDLEHSFELQIDPEIESQASRLLEDNVLTEADFTELFPDNRMSDHKFGRNDLQELGMTGLEFDVNDIDYSLFANIFPGLRTSQPESISISNPF